MMMKIADLETMPVPEYVYIPMTQNYSRHCMPFVAVGDHVKVGQPIAYSEANKGAPIHASASGEIVKITEDADLQGVDDKVIVIKTDQEQRVWEGVQPPKFDTRADFLKALEQSGMIGMEGACLATHAQLDEKSIENDKILVINGAEWTKYTDFEWTLMKKDAEDIIEGACLTMKFMGLEKCYIGVREGEADAIRKLKACVTEKRLNTIEIVPLPQSCPPGSDRVVIYETTGDILAANNLPEDFGIVVASISSIAFLGSYAKSGMPLVRRVISVEGSAVKEPKNLMVPIGAQVSDIVEYCGGYVEEPKKLVMGGPAMGRNVPNGNVPLSKDNNSILAFREEEIPVREEISCKNCDSCKRVCPIHLDPEQLYDAFEAKDVHQLKELGLEKCTECGRCAFVCPAAKPLSYMIEQAKILIQS